MLVSATFCGQAQVENPKVVRLTDTTTKSSEIYSRTKLFFANEYASAKDVITFDDATTCTVVGRGWINLKSKNVAHKSVKLWHSLKVQCKDGRYRYELSDMKVEFVISGLYGGTQTITKDYDEMVSSIKETRNERKRHELEELWIKPITDLIDRLNAALNQSAASNW